MSFLWKKHVETLAKVLPIGNQRELPQVCDQRFVKLGLIVGHTASNPGARSAGGFTEYGYNSEIAQLVSKYASELGKLRVSIIRRDGTGIAGAYQVAEKAGCDAVIELHFNDFNGIVGGSETLCSPDLTDIEFAHEIHSGVCEAFNRKGMSRGVKVLSRSSRGAENIYSFPNGVNCLVEPFFGDNQSDVILAMNKKEEYAKALINSVLLWAKKNDFI